MPVTVRAAVEADLPAILALYRQLSATDLLPDAAEAAETWRQMLSSAFMTVHVAELDGRVVATCVLVIAPNLTRNMSPFGLIENVVTEEGLRGQGVGKHVVQAAIAQAWEAGCYKVMLLTGRKDPAVLAFYEACGFSRGKTAFEVRRPG